MRIVILLWVRAAAIGSPSTRPECAPILGEALPAGQVVSRTTFVPPDAGNPRLRRASVATTMPDMNAARRSPAEAPVYVGLPPPLDPAITHVNAYFQSLDNFCRVFAIRQGHRVLGLGDALLASRVIDAVSGLAKGRGATV